MLKEVKIKKTEQKEVTEGNITLKLTKGYQYTVSKGKDGKPLETPIVRYSVLDSYFTDESETTYRQVKKEEEISYKKCTVVNVCELITTRADGSTFKRVFETPSYLVGASAEVLKQFLNFRQL